MISHESPSLLSRLCTVLIADLTTRAAFNAMERQNSGSSDSPHVARRTTVGPQDLRNVTVGNGLGSGSEWEFLRDILEEDGEA